MTPLLTDADLARAFRTTPAKVRILADAEGLPHVAVPRVGRRFLPDEVERWVRDRKTNPQARPTGEE